jgi:hypothetical protein
MWCHPLLQRSRPPPREFSGRDRLALARVVDDLAQNQAVLSDPG